MSDQNHGGRRAGAGRPAGGGVYGEPTRMIRVPESRAIPVMAYLRRFRRSGISNVGGVYSTPLDPSPLEIPFLDSPRPQAGFPSPAGDYVEEALDLNKLLVPNPPATFFAVVAGDSLVDLGIFNKDVVVVNRSLRPVVGKIVVAVVDGDIFIKVLEDVGGRRALCSRNAARAADFPPIYLDKSQEQHFWGVVTGSFRRFT